MGTLGKKSAARILGIGTVASLLILAFQNCQESQDGGVGSQISQNSETPNSETPDIVDEDGENPNLVQPEACPSRKKLVIGMYGDSTMYGVTCSPGDPACQSYVQAEITEPSQLLIMLKDTFPCFDFEVRNHGVGGSKASDWIYNDGAVRNFGPNKTWEQILSSEQGQQEHIVVMNVAINDAYAVGVAPSNYTQNPNVPLLTRDIFKSYYRQFAQAAHRHKKIFVLDGPNPISNWAHNDILDDLVLDQAEVAAELKLPFANQYWKIVSFVPDWQIHLPDKVHPTATLYKEKAWFLFETIKPLVERF